MATPVLSCALRKLRQLLSFLSIESLWHLTHNERMTYRAGTWHHKDCWFRYATCQHSGSAHDAKVLKDSNLFNNSEKLIPKGEKVINGAAIPYFLLGDPAYPLLSWLLKGYKGQVSDEQQSESTAKYYQCFPVPYFPCCEILPAHHPRSAAKYYRRLPLYRLFRAVQYYQHTIPEERCEVLPAFFRPL